MILISSSGFSLYVFAFSILCTTSRPCTARPKIVCLPSSHDYLHQRIANLAQWGSTYRFISRDEELAAVGAGPRVRHADGVGPVVLQRIAELVFELLAPDALAAGAVAHRVAGLDHEFLDHAVEDDVVVVVPAGVRDEVLDGLGGGVGEEADGDVAVGCVNGGGGCVGRRACGFVCFVGVCLAGLFVLDVACGF